MKGNRLIIHAVCCGVLLVFVVGCDRSKKLPETSAIQAPQKGIELDSMGLISSDVGDGLRVTLKMHCDLQALGKKMISVEAVRVAVERFLQEQDVFSLTELKSLQVEIDGDRKVQLDSIAELEVYFERK